MDSAAGITFTDDFIESLFKGSYFGPEIDPSTTEKRKFLVKTLRNQQEGYWAGSTVYSLIVNAGFIYDGKSETKKTLTAVGAAFLKGNSHLVEE